MGETTSWPCRARRPARSSPGRVVRRRAAARRGGTRSRLEAELAAGRRADRQSRPARRQVGRRTVVGIAPRAANNAGGGDTQRRTSGAFPAPRGNGGWYSEAVTRFATLRRSVLARTLLRSVAKRKRQ